jgi:hypothetical protein
VESVCAVASSEDLPEDLPLDLLSPVCTFPDLVVGEAAPLVPATLLPVALALVCWPGAVVLPELELEVVCVPAEVPEEVELLVWDCDCVLAGAWGAEAGAGAGDWAILDAVDELPSISAAKLLAPVAAEESD